MASVPTGAVPCAEPSYYPGSPLWTSGEIILDNNFAKIGFEPKYFEQLGHFGVRARQALMKSMVVNNPRNPTS